MRIIWPTHSDKHSYGYQKDKYNPAAVYHLITGAALPSQSPNNAQYAPAVGNQDGVGICGGFAWREYFFALCMQLGAPVDCWSANWYYNLARWMEGTLSQDAGLSNDDVITMVAKFGHLREALWPFMDVLDPAAPSSERQAEAVKYPNFQGIRVDGGVDGIRSAMAAKHPLVVGGPFFLEWEDAPATGILSVPNLSSTIAGGHDTLWLDYDDTMVTWPGIPTGAFYCQNSWDITYGKAGRFYVPYVAVSIMTQMGGIDIHYAAMDATGAKPISKGCHISFLHQQLRKERGLVK